MAVPMRSLSSSSKQKFIVSKVYKPTLEGHLHAFFCAVPESHVHSSVKEKCANKKLAVNDANSVVKKNVTQQGRCTSAHKRKILKCGHQAAEKPVNIIRCGKIMKSMLYKTYWNMKDRKLIHNAEPVAVNTIDRQICVNSSQRVVNTDLDFISLEDTFYPSKKKLSEESKGPFINPDSVVEKVEDNKLEAKELFLQRMRIKYQDPSANTIVFLNERYPNPAQLFEDVVGPLMEAREQDLPEPVATSHLRQVYWRARLALPESLCVTATHPEKRHAVHNVFLAACDQLEKLGLIWLDKDRQWQPMTCDKVVSMLQTLSRYIDSSFVASKGRGFKIILKQAEYKQQNDRVCSKLKQSRLQVHKSKTNKIEIDCDENFRSKVWSKNLTEDNDICEKNSVISAMAKSENEKLNHFAREFCENRCLPDFSCFQTSPLSNSSTRQLRSLSQDQCHKGQHKANPWMCTVHVGWPFPFTIQAWSVSLPGAQMLGYMKVVTKLKTLGLLTSCNSRVSPHVLGRLMRIDAQTHWEKSVLSSLDHTLVQKFAADAELFCDASLTGFGAYLVFKEVEKVRWLCEAWEEHDKAFLDIVYPRKYTFESTLAELYATVTSVYSWKKKLRGKRLLCFSDSKTTVGLINTYLEKPVKEELCINSLDPLIMSLKETSATYNITLQAVWLDRSRNTLADKLSRRDTEAFQNTVPRAACKKSRTKKLSIPWAQYKHG